MKVSRNNKIAALVLAGIMTFAPVAMAAQGDTYVSGMLGGSVNADTGNPNLDLDEGFSGSFAVGKYVCNKVRLEAEYGYFQNDVEYNGHDNDMDTNTLMGNIYYDFDGWFGFVPYITAGIGVGWFDLEGIDEDSTMVYKFGGGIDYKLTNDLKVGARYTYFEADNVDFNSNMIGAVVSYNF
jgi:opacity protein-like surface antigen